MEVAAAVNCHPLMVERGGTHWRCLLAAIEATRSSVLELGAGWCSTPLLHVVTAPARFLLTLDSDADWIARFSELKNDRHMLRPVTSWFNVKAYDEAWDVALVDQAPNEARWHAVESLRKTTKIIVLHDVDEQWGRPKLDAWAFRYEYVSRLISPHTALLSDSIDIRGLIR
jgi:hypothetical protein